MDWVVKKRNDLYGISMQKLGFIGIGRGWEQKIKLDIGSKGFVCYVGIYLFNFFVVGRVEL